MECLDFYHHLLKEICISAGWREHEIHLEALHASLGAYKYYVNHFFLCDDFPGMSSIMVIFVNDFVYFVDETNGLSPLEIKLSNPRSLNRMISYLKRVQRLNDL